MQAAMNVRKLTSIFLILLAAVFAAAILSGCGDDQKATTTTAKITCDPNAPSIIPPPSGRPQLVEFFRDT